MKEPTKDDERLSALVEGRVSGPQREELLAHLSASEDDYEVFTDTVEILSALEEEDARAAAGEGEGVIPLRRGGRGWRAPARWLAMAAAAAGIVLVSALALRGRMPAGGDPVRLAAAVYDSGEPLDFGGAPPWSVGRGDGPSGDAQVDAARAGALMVDLAVAARARNGAETRRLARQVSADFEPNVGGATPLRQIAAHPDAPPDVLERLLDRATERLADNLDGDYLQLGAWARAAGYAAAAKNEDFLSGDASRDMLRRADRLTRGDAEANRAVAQVRDAIPAQGAPTWPALEAALKALLREIAS